MSSTKRRPLCLDLNVITKNQPGDTEAGTKPNQAPDLVPSTKPTDNNIMTERTTDYSRHSERSSSNATDARAINTHLSTLITHL